MKALETIYWLRLVLGITVALLCIGYGLATETITNDPSKITSDTLLTGIFLALVTYLTSYYIIKFKFMNKVEKPRKLITTGIGIYILAWIVFWVLLYTIIARSPLV